MDNGFHNTKFYVDDGVSGTTFERDSFKEIIDDVENVKIRIIITKDLSKPGKDYLKTGELIEITFLDYKVNYIAVNDDVDMFKNENKIVTLPKKS